MFKEYKVWDFPVRFFHWINFMTVISLIFVGLIMLYKKELGISSIDAKIALKELHIIIGYVFAVNLLVRIVWGFIGNQYARWSYIFPGKGFIKEVSHYKMSIKEGNPQQFIGHNPLGRLAISFILFLLIILAMSGIIRAGTDVYYPPLGSYFAEYVADSGVNPDTIIPYNPTGTNETKVKELKAFKGPIGKIHLYSAYTLMFIIFVHIFFVVLTEVREGGGLITAMFTGKKVLNRKPLDFEQ
ncbi:MAG: cytochrome b/b6 domain-containing protein [Gammaproteobacteria bacterium]|nr:cytochrome b/b6 domain-containing protein [Gammaproteobacteria bacterium]